MLPFQKKAVTLILGPHPDSGAGDQESGDSSGEDLRRSAEALIQAVHAKDAGGVMEALESAVSTLYAKLEQEEEGKPEDSAEHP